VPGKSVALMVKVSTLCTVTKTIPCTHIHENIHQSQVKEVTGELSVSAQEIQSQKIFAKKIKAKCSLAQTWACRGSQLGISNTVT